MSEILGTLFKYLISLLAVAAVVIVLYQVFGSTKVESEVSQITLLAGKARSLYAGQNYFTSLTTAVAINAKWVNANATNPWGGNISLAVNGVSTNFDITETGVPQDGCSGLANALRQGVFALSINGTALVLPVDPGVATTACNLPANTLVITFGH